MSLSDRVIGRALNTCARDSIMTPLFFNSHRIATIRDAVRDSDFSARCEQEPWWARAELVRGGGPDRDLRVLW